jgi:hypothetical protein
LAGAEYVVDATVVSISRRWPSLADQLRLADELYGPRGGGLVCAWLDQELDRVGDFDFACEFAAHIDLPGVSTLDYAHRVVRTPRGELLGGIRFYNRNVQRPFVDILAHSFGDLGTLADCVQREWSMFNAAFMRLRCAPGGIVGGGVVLDHTIHVSRYDQMPAPDNRVRLELIDEIDEVIAAVLTRYARLAHDEPELAKNISPAPAEDLRQWHAHNQIRAIRVGRTTVGILAIAPGSVGWLIGDEVNEEVINTPHLGHGYAASAQTAWAAHVAADRARPLIGTIDRHNHASRLTAARAQRHRVLDDVFVTLRPASQVNAGAATQVRP